MFEIPTDNQHFLDSVVKPFIPHARECWGDSLKNDYFAKKIDQFHQSMYKQKKQKNQALKNVSIISRFFSDYFVPFARKACRQENMRAKSNSNLGID